jgi:hypothetical protein
MSEAVSSGMDLHCATKQEDDEGLVTEKSAAPKGVSIRQKRA